MHSGGGGAPPGGTMASCQELADGGVKDLRRKRGPPPEGERRGRAPKGAPVGDPAGDLRPNFRRSAYPRGRPRGAAFRTSACRRSAPLFLRERKTDEGPPPPSIGRRTRWLSDNRIYEDGRCGGAH